MRLAWRNGFAYLLLAFALIQYAVTGFVFAHQFFAPIDSQMNGATFKTGLLVGWITGPAPLIGWAAVVEYLFRIASALQKKSA